MNKISCYYFHHYACILAWDIGSKNLADGRFIFIVHFSLKKKLLSMTHLFRSNCFPELTLSNLAVLLSAFFKLKRTFLLVKRFEVYCGQSLCRIDILFSRRGELALPSNSLSVSLHFHLPGSTS